MPEEIANLYRHIAAAQHNMGDNKSALQSYMRYNDYHK